MTTNTLVCPLCGKLYFSPCDHTARDLIAEIERLKAQSNETCKWVLEDNEYGVWDTRCGEAVVFDEETPKANGYKYCHHCGKLIEFETESANE